MTMRESVENIWGWDQQYQDARFREEFNPSRCQIVEVEGERVGVVAVDTRPNEIFLANIQIIPEHQGNGLGTALIQSLQRQASATGSKMALQVNRANRARRLYERIGFAVTDETETHYLMQWVSDDTKLRKPGI